MNAYAYLESRGISRETAVEARVWGADGRVWLPWYDEAGERIYATGRALDGEEPKYRNDPGERPALYASPGAWEAPAVVLVEGPLDALAAYQAGVPAFATMSASLSDEAARVLAGKATVILVPDNDEAGERWLAAAIERLWGRTELMVARVPRPHKDLADAATDADDVLDAAGPAEPAWRTSWGPDSSDGEESPPSRLSRTDGEHLLYPGKLHWLQGEPESGKTWYALAAGVEALGRGEWMLFVDFEDSGPSIRSRLRAMGADLSRLIYVRPGEPLEGDAVRDVERLMSHGPTVAVLDGVAECMALHGLDPIRAMDAATFINEVVGRFRGPNVCTIVIDHVARGEAGRGRYAYGSQHKLAGIDGVAYRFETLQAFSREHGGAARVDVTKDRPGYIRSFALDKERAGILRVIPSDDGLVVQVEPPMVGDQHGDGLRYTERRVLAVLEPDSGGGLTYGEIGDRLANDGRGKPLKRNTIKDAIDGLIEGGLADGIRSDGRAGASTFWRKGEDT